MTNFIQTKRIIVALALTVSMSAAPTLVAAQNSMAVHKEKIVIQSSSVALAPKLQSTARPEDTHTATPDPFCPPGDIIVVYEEDSNGNRIPGTEDYGCAD